MCDRKNESVFEIYALTPRTGMAERRKEFRPWPTYFEDFGKGAC